MAKFKCNKCNKELELAKHTIKVEDGMIVSPEAMCCEIYMESVRENHGFGKAIMRPGGKVKGKN